MNQNLDDVIEYYSKIAETLRKQVRIEDNDYMDKVDEVYTCEQLAEWLNELKLLRERIDAQPEQRWIPVAKEQILQAGYEGREVRFHIGGRLFAIRELAQ